MNLELALALPIVFLLLFVVALIALGDYGEALFWLVLGWCGFPFEAISMGWTPDCMAMGSWLVTLFILCVGVHLNCDWLFRSLRRGMDYGQPMWKGGWTLAMVTGSILCLGIGILLIGIVHQATWLLTTDEPLLAASYPHGYVEAARLRQPKNNLRSIGQSLWNYESAMNRLPPGGTRARDGRMLHSWETQILPFIDQQALFQKIDLNREWDATENVDLFRTQLHLFITTSIPQKQNPAGFALSHYAANVRVMGPHLSLKFLDVADGLENTIVAGEVRTNFKAWGDPRNWRDPVLGINKSPNGFGGPYPGGTHFLMGDGSVRLINEKIDPRLLKALSTPDAGDDVQGEW